jgi:hypothetical protein
MTLLDDDPSPHLIHLGGQKEGRVPHPSDA